MDVLNPTLYKALERIFGDVHVVAQGVAITWHITRRPTRDGDDTYPTRKVDVQGEEYEVNCPFCRDTRHRLSINHRWAVPDPNPELTSKNLWLMHCYNEECQDEPTNQTRLFDMVYPAAGPRTLSRIKVATGTVRALRPTVMAAPGPMVRLDKLAERHPQHEALSYLRSRYLDPLKLARYYGVSYCNESDYRFARNRIIFPVYMQGLLVGWQARYIGDSVMGQPFNKAKVPKFFSCPGQAKRVIAFNYDRATRHPTLVIVEGPTDVSNFGVQAMGILGKVMHESFQKSLCSLMKRRWGDDGVIVVMLDPVQDELSLRKGKPHHLTRLTTDLQKYHPRVLPVFLPDEYDPGSYDLFLARDLIRDEAAQAGFKVSFAKPPRIDDDEESTAETTSARFYRHEPIE
jgi:hypothetical protein